MAEPRPKAEPEKAYIKDRTGSVLEVASADLPKALAEKRGASIASPEEVKHAFKEERMGTGLLTQAESALYGAARSASLGGSDVVGRAVFGKGFAEHASGLKEVAPTANLGGELIGFLPGMVGGGGAGVASKALGVIGAPIRGMTALGGLAERGAAKLVGEGAASLGGRVVQRAIPMAARGAVEGGVMGAGQAVSEAALGDHELTAERLAASVGKNALLGGILGGGIGVASELTSSAFKGAASKLLKNTEALDLDKMSNEFVWRGSGASKKATEAANTYAGGSDRIGRLVKTELPKELGVKNLNGVSQDVALGGTRSLEQKYAAGIDDVVTKVDDIAAKRSMQPRAQEVIETLEREVLEPLKLHAGAGAKEARVANFIERAKKTMGLVDDAGMAIEGAESKAISIRELRDLRKMADDAWRGNKFGPMRDEFSPFRDIRGTIERDVEQRIGAIGKAEGAENLVLDYMENKKSFQAFKLYGDALENGIAKGQTNQYFGLTNKIVGGASAAVGAAVGAPFGMPGLGAAAGGALGGLGSKFVSQRFDYAAATLLDKASKIQGLANLSVNFDKALDGATKAVFSKSTEPAISAASKFFGAGETRTKNVTSTIQNIQRMAQNPTAAADTMSRNMGSLPTYAPKTAQQLATKTALALGYLASNTPKSQAQPNLFNMATVKPVYSEVDVSKFANRLKATFDPMSIIDDMRKGQLKPESVDAVKNVYPRLFADMQTKIMTNAVQLQKSIPYDQQIQLGYMFDIPVNPTQNPEFVRAVQESMGQNAAQQNQSGGLPPVSENKQIKEQYSTAADSLEESR